ncbi:MAG: GntR family transcriptional regulator [Planctomycetia bacterium]|nr:GntR family transcriptional regulator [Planctomycetia bacterium]
MVYQASARRCRVRNLNKTNILTMTLQSKEAVYDQIYSRILDGTYPFGTRLTERAVAEQLSVSRTPVREALARLVQQGIASTIPGGGVCLKETNRTDIVELFELRFCFESFALRKAVERHAPYFITRMEESCAAILDITRKLRDDPHSDSKERWQIVTKAEADFHMSIVHATGNSQFIQNYNNALLLTQTLCRFASQEEPVSLPELIETWCDHRRILRAIKSGQAEKAVSLLRQHIQKAIDLTLDLYDQEQSRLNSNIKFPLRAL